MATSELLIQETIEVKARQSQGQVGQADYSPHLKPALRTVTDTTGNKLTHHGEVVRTIKNTDGDVKLIPDDGTDATLVYYLVILSDVPGGYLTVKFTQATTARVLRVGKVLVLDFTDDAAAIDKDSLTVAAYGQDAQVRCYWAGLA